MDSKSLHLLDGLYSRMESSRNKQDRDQARVNILYFVRGYINAQKYAGKTV